MQDRISDEKMQVVKNLYLSVSHVSHIRRIYRAAARFGDSCCDKISERLESVQGSIAIGLTAVMRP